MSTTFTVLLLCMQACLVQNVFGYGCGCGGQVATIAPALGLGAGLSPAGPCGGALGLGAYGGAIRSAYGGALAPAAVYGGAITPGAAYGSTGEGNVVVIGELPIAGNTAVGGQVPIIGVVSFGGAIPAAGAVSISGQSVCGCGSPIY